MALARLAELGDEVQVTIEPADDEEVLRSAEQRIPLNTQRHEAVHGVLRELGARSVIDLGCGSGQFLERLVKDPSFTRVAGSDVSMRSLQHAARRLHVDRMSERQSERIDLFQGALTYQDQRYAGFEAAVLMEVIEHVDPSRLAALEHIVFGAARPGSVIVTTPNREYNALYEGLVGLRHPDHRFEWTRAQFGRWSDRVAASYGYSVQRRGIGDLDERRGTPTVMAIFTRAGGDDI